MAVIVSLILLVWPLHHAGFSGTYLVLGKLSLCEPELDLLGGAVEGVRSVDEVATWLSARALDAQTCLLKEHSPDRDGVLATDGSRVGLLGVGGAYDAALGSVSHGLGAE